MYKYIIINIILVTISTLLIIYFIETHSVHPERDKHNLIKTSYTIATKYNCSPWESCK